MIALKLIALCVFIFFWLRSKRSQTIEVSDIFTLSFLAIYMPGFLFNSDGVTQLNSLSLARTAERSADVGMLAVLGIGSLVYMIRQISEQRYSVLTWRARPRSDTQTHVIAASGAALVALFCLGSLMMNAEFVDFKLNVLRFFTFQFEGLEYRYLRNHGYEASWVIEGLVGRARFSLFPLLFCLILYPFVRARYYISVIAIATLFFIGLPASLSKLPAVLFLCYLGMIVLSRRPTLLDLGWVVMIALVGIGAIVTALILLYTAQYQGSVLSGALDPVGLALERIWGEPYSIVVRYFHVYPNVVPFTGLSGINFVARVLSLPIRMPDVEVAELTLGPDSGSNPGVFFLGGYAAFGRMGLVAFALIGFLYLWILDLIGRRVRLDVFRVTYLATVGANSLFLNQIALQTALVTYGLIFLPLTIALLDKIASFRSRNLPETTP